MIYPFISESAIKGKKLLAVLIDPDKDFLPALDASIVANCDLILVGGSLLVKGDMETTISEIKKQTNIPVVLFPGNASQVATNADGIFFLSLISGRNSDFLIGQQVVAAPLIKKANIEVIPTGYVLMGNTDSSVSYMSNTQPIPYNKPEIAAATALAGEMLGLKQIYLEAGSGAEEPVSTATIKAVKKQVDIPIIVGGGIKNTEQARAISQAGADVIVVGNAAEKDASVLMEIKKAINEPHSYQLS